MSYRFCFGASGAGKSLAMQREMAARAQAALERLSLKENFLYIVPEQYTMQTQKDLVMMSGSRGIMNIDVLSFGRLAHRIFEEQGITPVAPLNDLGKMLILRRLASSMSDKLPFIGSLMNKPGMISEVKSVISEFMQYGISAEDIDDMAGFAGENRHGALEGKLRDIKKLYEAFLGFEKDRFMTEEEELSLLAGTIRDSALIRESVIVFDGFTGFTPVQYSVLEGLLQNAKEVVFCITIAEDGGPRPADFVKACMEEKEKFSEEDLFYLSRKTIRDIIRCAGKAGASHGEDTDLTHTASGRFDANPALEHLEKSLFRHPARPFKEETDSIRIIRAATPKEEVREMFVHLRRTMRQEGYAYRDFGIITGDLASYADEIKRQAALYKVPVYIDTTRNVKHDPLTEHIRGALEIAASDYSYPTVFRFLRSGLSDLSREKVDRLENYCLEHGIRSRRKWQSAFEAEAEEGRQEFLREIGPLMPESVPEKTAAGRTKALYEFMVQGRLQEKLAACEERAAGEQDQLRQSEYKQIYARVIDLLDQIYMLLGDEPISARDYRELIETGLSEIRLGTLPQKADRVLAGDIERTRMTQVKVLYLLGANDGSIPRSTSKGGLLSDPDREILVGCRKELSPSPRQQMYIQRLYLYLNMTKPSRQLWVSYARVSSAGGSIRPSYLIARLKNLFPFIAEQLPEQEPVLLKLTGPEDLKKYLASSLRMYADGMFDRSPEDAAVFLSLYGFAAGPETADAVRIGQLTEAAFSSYKPKPLSKEAAAKLYGRVLRTSASRLEIAAQCYLRQYLRYGLGLEERKEYVYQAKDAGTVLHESIERFFAQLSREGLDCRNFSDEDAERLIREALHEEAAVYENSILYDSARSTSQIKRIERILDRTVKTLRYQVQQGDFVPAASEAPFGGDGSFALQLDERRYAILQGRIDRYDIFREGEKLLVKIVDYKSGLHDLDRAYMKEGLQIQLMLYMEAARELLKRKYPGAQTAPAALLYYHLDDPVLTGDIARSLAPAGDHLQEVVLQMLERSGEAVMKKLCPKGLVSADDDAVHHLDTGLGAGRADSCVIPVKLLKAGGFAKTSKIFTGEEYDLMREELFSSIRRLCLGIMDGRTDASPVNLKNRRNACTFCEFKDVCGFDVKLPGYRRRDIQG